MPHPSPAATAAHRPGRTPVNLGYLVAGTAPAAAHTEPPRFRTHRSAEEEGVATHTAAALESLQRASVWSAAAGYGDQFAAALDDAIKQVEYVRGMLA